MNYIPDQFDNNALTYGSNIKFIKPMIFIDYYVFLWVESEIEVRMLRKSVESNSLTNTQRLSAELGVAQWTDVWHLKAIGKVNKRWKEVPHDLTKNQANRRVETCRKLLENPRDDRFIR